MPPDADIDGSPLALLLSWPIGYVVAAFWGGIWGSFFNVAIHRLAREDARLRDVAWPPSSCPACGARIRSRDNVPLLGWLLLRGRCRDCGAPISVRYPLVEAVSMGLAVAVLHGLVIGHAGPPSVLLARFLVYFAFVGVLLVLSLIDLDTMLLPEAITLPAIPFFFLCGRLVGEVELGDAALGLALGFGLLKGLQLGYLAATGREGLGGGDSMLMAIIGGLLGWRSIPFTLGLGALMGTMVSVPMLLWQRRRASGRDAAAQHVDAALHTEHAATQQTPEGGVADEQGDVPIGQVEVPFGPFLAAGALVYLFFKDAAWIWLTAAQSGE